MGLFDGVKKENDEAQVLLDRHETFRDPGTGQYRVYAFISFGRGHAELLRSGGKSRIYDHECFVPLIF